MHRYTNMPLSSCSLRQSESEETKSLLQHSDLT